MCAAAQVPEPPPPLPGRARPDPAKAALVKKLERHGPGGRPASSNLVPEVLATRRDLEQLAAGAARRRTAERLAARVLGERLLAAL